MIIVITSEITSVIASVITSMIMHADHTHPAECVIARVLIHITADCADCNQVREYVEQLIVPLIIKIGQLIIKIGADCNQVREYVEQLIVPSVNGAAVALLNELHRFQERLYLKDPAKAARSRRYMCGLREATRALRTNKARV